MCVLQVAQEGKETSAVKESKSRERQGTLFPSQLFLISYSAETQSALIFNLLSLRMSLANSRRAKILTASAMYQIQEVMILRIIRFELHPSDLDQTLGSKSGQTFNFMTKHQLPSVHRISDSTSATETTSTSSELASSHARVSSIKFTKQH